MFAVFPDRIIGWILSYLPSTALTNPGVPFFGSLGWPNQPGSFLYRSVHSKKTSNSKRNSCVGRAG